MERLYQPFGHMFRPRKVGVVSYDSAICTSKHLGASRSQSKLTSPPIAVLSYITYGGPQRTPIRTVLVQSGLLL